MPKKVDRHLGEAAMREANAGLANAPSSPDQASAFDKLAKVLAPIAKRKPSPLSIFPNPEGDGEAGTSSWERQLLDAAIIELALSLGVPLRIPAGDPRSYTFWLYAWARRRHHALDRLERVGAHPFFGQVLVASFFPTRETKNEVGNWLERAAAVESHGFDGVFAALDAFGKTMNETWTLGALEVHAPWIEGVCAPSVFARCPSLAAAIRELSAARLLRNQLRAGMMDEWGWSAREEALALFPKERERDVSSVASGPLPYGVLLDTKDGRVVAFAEGGVVLDRPLPAAKKMKDVRNLLYADGDVLVCEYHPFQARWVVAGGKPFEVDPWAFFGIGSGDALITKGRTLLHPGEARWDRAQGHAYHRIWYDGLRYYGVPQETVVRADGTSPKSDESGVEVFDPKTGKTDGHALPEWMAALLGAEGMLVAHIQSSFICPVSSAEASPLGAKDGFGGFALFTRAGEMVAQGIDGRHASGIVNGKHVVALMTFPERGGLYRVIENVFDIGVAMPDGTTPLIPADGLTAGYWAGTPPLSLLDWHALRTRDQAASRALARCTDEAAKVILESATAPDEEPEVVTKYKKMQAVMKSASKHGNAPSALVAAISRALPDVKHPRMLAGVAGLAQVAARVAPIVTRLKGRLAVKPPTKGEESPVHNADAVALSRLFDHETPWWVEKLGIQLGQQILDVSHFLFGEPTERLVTPARTVVPWELLLQRMGEILYRVLAPGTPKARRAELVTLLELWLETGFPSNMKSLQLVQLALPTRAPEVAGLDREHPDRLIAWDNRYFLRWGGAKDSRVILRGIERTQDGAKAPLGATIEMGGSAPQATERLRLESLRFASRFSIELAEPADARFGTAAITKTLALLAERGPVKLDPAVPERIARKTKLGKGAATLVWAAGYDPWLMGEKKRDRFGVDRPTLDRAEVELRNLRLRELYVHAMPDDPAAMYDDALTVADRIATWAALK